MSDWRQKFQDDLSIYEFRTVLPGTGETVVFKPITTKTLKKLLVYENSKEQDIIESILDELIINSLVDGKNENFNINDVFLQDRFHLLLEIRKVSKGESYEYTYSCPNCKSQSLQKINLNNVVSKPKNKIEGNILPITKNISIEVDFVKRSDQKQAFEYVKKTYPGAGEKLKSANNSVTILATAIKSIKVDGIEEENINLADKVYLLDSIPNSKIDEIRTWFENNTFGPDLEIITRCPHCGHEEKTDVPMSNFF